MTDKKNTTADQERSRQAARGARDISKARRGTKIIEEIATARAHGDLSENAEYHAAKEQQGMQEARVRQIREMLENAEIVEARTTVSCLPGSSSRSCTKATTNPRPISSGCARRRSPRP